MKVEGTEIEIVSIMEMPWFEDTEWYKELIHFKGKWVFATPKYAKKLKTDAEIEFDEFGTFPEGLTTHGSNPLPQKDFANKTLIITKVDRQRDWFKAGIKWREGHVYVPNKVDKK